MSIIIPYSYLTKHYQHISKIIAEFPTTKMQNIEHQIFIEENPRFG
jgi:hypothetical protein